MRTLALALALASVSEAAKTEVKMQTKAKMHSKAKMHMKDGFGDGNTEAVQGDGDDFDQAMAGPTPEQIMAMHQAMAVKRAQDQHSMMSQFMSNFGANMKMAVLSDSEGDMPEEERQKLMEQLREKGAVVPQEDDDDMDYFPTMKRQRPQSRAQPRYVQQRYSQQRYAQPLAEQSMQYQEPLPQQTASMTPEQIAALEERQAEQQDRLAAEGRSPRRPMPQMPMDEPQDAGSAALQHLQQMQSDEAPMAPPMTDDGVEAAPMMPAPVRQARPRLHSHMLNAQGHRLRHHHHQEAESAVPRDGASVEESAAPKVVRDEMGRPMPLLFADQSTDQAPPQPAAPAGGQPAEPQAASAPVAQPEAPAPQAAAQNSVVPVKPETKQQQRDGLDGAVPVGSLPQEHGKGHGHHHHHHKHHKHHLALADQKSFAFTRSVGTGAFVAALSALVVV